MKRLISIRRTQDRRAAEAPRPPEDYSMKTLYILVTAVVAATLMIATSHADNRNITFQAEPLLATQNLVPFPLSQFVFHVDTNGDGSADLFITETSNSFEFDMKPSVERCFSSDFVDCQLFISFGISEWDFGNGNFFMASSKKNILGSMKNSIMTTIQQPTLSLSLLFKQPILSQGERGMVRM